MSVVNTFFFVLPFAFTFYLLGFDVHVFLFKYINIYHFRFCLWCPFLFYKIYINIHLYFPPIFPWFYFFFAFFLVWRLRWDSSPQRLVISWISHLFLMNLNGTLIIYWIESVSRLSSVSIDVYSFASFMLIIVIMVYVIFRIMESLHYSFLFFFCFNITLVYLYSSRIILTTLPFFFTCSIMSMNGFSNSYIIH